MAYEDLRYNEVRQTSSHNAFQRLEGIYDQVVYWRIRSLEIDLHRGKPFRSALKKDWYIYLVPWYRSLNSAADLEESGEEVYRRVGVDYGDVVDVPVLLQPVPERNHTYRGRGE